MHYASTFPGNLLLVAILFVCGERDLAESRAGSLDRGMFLNQETRSTPGPFGCTIIMARRDGLVLVGNNEDRNNTETIVNFVPPSEKYFGRVVFGYADGPFQGGMNDQGLFIDANAVRSTGWESDTAKPTCSWLLMMTLLATCASCEDVKGFFEHYNVPALDLARFPVADRSGASMVVEYAHGRVHYVTSDQWYQIATNFIMSNVKEGAIACWRYRVADSILARAKTLNVGLVRNVLELTHQEGNALTVYSNIYDLKRGIVYLYNLRNFQKVVVMNLCDELKKGERRLELPSLFEDSLRTRQ